LGEAYNNGLPVIHMNDSKKINLIKPNISIETKLLAEEIQRRNLLIGRLLRLFLKANSKEIFLKEALKLIQLWIGIESAGIRAADEQGNIPYAAYSGFDKNFIDSENWLSLNHHHCACTRIISGKIEPQDTPAVTSGGSFFCGNTHVFLNNLNEDDKQRYRGVCIQNGFKTVGIIPIRYGEKILGAMHLADHHADAVSADNILFLESAVSPLIGEGVYRFNVEAQLQRNLETQTVISSLLEYSLEDLTLDEILAISLDLIHATKSFSFGRKSSIFLIEDHTDELCLKVSRGFSKYQKIKCGRVPLGKCLCGKAAKMQRPLFAESDDPVHEINLPTKIKHSHCCIPIQSGRNTIGIINLSLEYHHRKEDKEEEFLTAIANVLAGIILRKRSENKLRALSSRLVNVQEEERRSVALELHDQIGQQLTGLKLMISQAGRTHGDKKQQVINEAQVAVSDLIVKVREMSLNLRPSMLDDLGLLPSLVWMFDQSQTNSRISIEFRHSGLDQTLPKDVILAAYRIIQEALTNIMRYAGVDKASVNVWNDGKILHIRVEDKGKGFNYINITGSSSVGLLGIRERALLLGGNLAIESAPGVGTIVLAELPVL
jgi:signal transduction histidine kinase